MSRDELRTGCVIRFPYLWVREAERGETEGRKPRPVAVGVQIARPKGEDLLVLFPITSQPPSSDRFAVEIPEMEKRRAGLDASLRLWIILDEYNQDVIGQSFYLEPDSQLGHFSKAFFLPLMKEFIARRASRAALTDSVRWTSLCRETQETRSFAIYGIHGESAALHPWNETR